MFSIESPTQARLALIKAEGILKVLATQMDGTTNCLGHVGFGGEKRACHPAARLCGKWREGRTMAAQKQMVEISVTRTDGIGGSPEENAASKRQYARIDNLQTNNDLEAQSSEPMPPVFAKDLT